MKTILILGLLAANIVFCAAADAPPTSAFQILPTAKTEAPAITPHLKYQTEMAWRQDDERLKHWQGIKTEQDVSAVQQKIEDNLLAMLGGLPPERTPLRPQITGKLQMDGFHIEKLIFESLPGVYVSSLLYVPDDSLAHHPAILVAAGHAPTGKSYYQALCQRLVQRGYVVISWDPIGQGERSQFWDTKTGKSRYNLICAEHAVLGNLAYLAGTNLARWEIWDGIRAVDYLLTRSEVDSERISITGSSGGGFQAAHIAALDRRIKVAAPSCYISALPMRMYNRIFKDPDSDPEQDLYGMMSNHVDHAGLLLMMYPRPVLVAAAVLDFFPIEGTHRTVREVADIYRKFQHADRIAMAEGYHEHQFSPENQERAMDFLDHFNGMPKRQGLPPVKELDDKLLQTTRTGQVMLDFEGARSLMDMISEYYVEHKSSPAQNIKQIYYSDLYPRINSWSVSEYKGEIPGTDEIRWEARGNTKFEDLTIDKYLLHHSQYLSLPLLYIHKQDGVRRPVLIWLGETSKASAPDWPSLNKYLNAGFEILSFDPRGLGETRMSYKAVSPDDPALTQLDFDHAYVNPLSSVLADYVYNSLLTGRPYFLQMIEDVEIVTRFYKAEITLWPRINIVGAKRASGLASAVSETLPNVTLLSQPDDQSLKWSDLVDQKTELWPIEYLLPAGAYVH
jgi:hypothetical protein